MPQMTSFKLSIETRDHLREAAEREGVTMEGMLKKMIRRERAELIGRQLAARGLSDEDRMMMDASISDVHAMLTALERTPLSVGR